MFWAKPGRVIPVLRVSEVPGIDGIIIIIWIFRKWVVGLWTGSSWFSIGADGGHLCMQLWTFWFHTMWAISWLTCKTFKFVKMNLLHGVSKKVSKGFKVNQGFLLILHSGKLDWISEPCRIRKGPTPVIYSDLGHANWLVNPVGSAVLKEKHSLQSQYSATKPAWSKQTKFLL